MDKRFRMHSPKRPTISSFSEAKPTRGLAQKSVGSRSPFIRNNRTHGPRPWTGDASQPGCVKPVNAFREKGIVTSTTGVRCAAATCSADVGCTDAQFNSTVVHFAGLYARCLTHRVYQFIETAWEFCAREGLSRRRPLMANNREKMCEATDTPGCRCSKTYPITEDAHPRPRQSAMLGNLSVLGIRSP
jgi:hypothetical protein